MKNDLKSKVEYTELCKAVLKLKLNIKLTF